MEPSAPAQIASTVSSGFTGLFVLSHTSKVWLLIGTRFILVSMMAIAAMIAMISAYNWVNAEGNELKVHENKRRLGNAIAMITLFFVLMAIYHYFVPDYSLLAL